LISTTSADLISIREASRIVGAHIGTLRDWADAGILPSYRTPGGHRRFSRVDLEKFLAERRTSSPIALNSTEQALTRVRQELRSSPPSIWLKGTTALPQEHDLARPREFGQRLLTCVVRFLEEPKAREQLLAEGQRTARDYGCALLGSGLSAGSAARATIHFRQLILKAVLEVNLGSRTQDEEDAQLFQRVSAFLDEILLAILEAYP
jgi:excisionase family DNA binding protein